MQKQIQSRKKFLTCEKSANQQKRNKWWKMKKNEQFTLMEMGTIHNKKAAQHPS
jgi:hypothetical protein